MKMKWMSLVLCVMIACAPALALAQETSNEWDALMAQALGKVEELTAPEGTLRVQASASVNVVPDTAQISLGMSVVKPELSAAQEEANTIVNALVEALANLGVEKSDILTSNYSISPQRDYANGDGTNVTGYYVSNNITVKLDDFALLDTVIDTAVQAGANEVYGVSFDVKDRSAYYRQALGDAVGAAQEKAQLLAQAAGVTLGAIASISEESTIENYARYANMADSVAEAGSAKTSIQGGELSVTAQVELVYSYKVIETEPVG